MTPVTGVETARITPVSIAGTVLGFYFGKGQ